MKFIVATLLASIATTVNAFDDTHGLTGVFFDYNPRKYELPTEFDHYEDLEVERQWCGHNNIVNWPDPGQPSDLTADPLDNAVQGNMGPEYFTVPGVTLDKYDIPGQDYFEGKRNEEHFAVKFCGFIHITTPGSYKFLIIHDDGMQFHLDGQLAINHDEAINDGVSMTTVLFTEPGWIPITVRMFEAYNEANLVLKWTQPGDADGAEPYVIDTMFLKPAKDYDGDGIPDVCFLGFKHEPGHGGACGGDPHFTRWGQTKRSTFHGECDLVLFHKSNFEENVDIDIHVRTTIDRFYSFIESTAIQIGEDSLEFIDGQVYHNGVLAEVKVAHHYSFGEDGRFKVKEIMVGKKKNRSTYQVSLDDKVTISIKPGRYNSVKIHGAEQFMKGSTGLLGEYGTGDMIARDGESVATDFEEHAFEWQVRPSDPQIFSQVRAPQYPEEKCRMPAETSPSRRHLRGQDTVLYEDALEACQSNHKENIDSCVDDVMMTGDLELAEAW